MPPKTKFSKEDTLQAAFQIVRRHGWDKLSARSIAAELGSSTMPIYSNLGSMDNLEELIVKKALDMRMSYQQQPRTGEAILDMGLGYVLFAKQEPNLFKAINHEKYGHLQVTLGNKNFEYAVKLLADDPRAEGVPIEKLRKLVLLWWVFIHGLADLHKNQHGQEYSETEISEFIKEAGGMITIGLFAEAPVV